MCCADKIGIKTNSIFVNTKTSLCGKLLARPENKPKTQLAIRLREVRRVLGDPERSTLVESLGVSVGAIARYERGEAEPTAAVIARYKSEFGINTDWLVSGEGEMYVDPTKAPVSAGLRAINEVVFTEVGSLVAKVHTEEGIKLPLKALLKEQSSAYNTLIGRAEDPGDTDELLSLLSWLEARLRKSLKAAAAEPGTGKQQA